MMSFNNSTSFEDVLYTVSSSISIVLFIPATILYGICITALLFAKGISNQMRILLINVLISRFFARLLHQLFGFIADSEYNPIVCKFDLSLIFAGFLISLTSISLFSIMVYLSIKNGNNKLKWYIIIPSITVSWIVSILFGTLFYTDSTFIIIVEERDCEVSSESILFLPYVFFGCLAQAVFLTVTLVFGILTICFMRRRLLHETAEDPASQSDPKIKKAITKVLVYLIVRSFMDIPSAAFPTLIVNILTNVKLATVSSLASIWISTLSVLTPTILIILLEPICEALKGFKGCVYTCLRMR